MEKCKDYQPAQAKELSGETGSIELQTKFIPGCIGDYGCCEDGFSPAKGPNQAGCPGTLRKIKGLFTRDRIQMDRYPK